MSRLPKGRTTLLAALATALFLAGFAACSNPLTTFEPRSDAADRIHTLYIIVIVAASLVGAVVLGAMAYILVRFRERPGRVADQTHGHTKLEIAWTIAPILVLVAIGIPTFYAIAGASRDPSPDALRVTATGHQWWFEFEYPGLGPDGGTLVTANELHIPVGRQVAIDIESADVIHSFWVPQLVGKTDMIANHPNRLEPFTPNEIGIFAGQCAEFCGSAHAMMRFRVHVESLADFERWVAGMNKPAPEPPPDTAEAIGRRTFGFQCARCHAVAGTNFLGTVGPSLTLFGERTTVGAGILPSTDDNVRQWVSDVRSLKPIVDDGGIRFMPTFSTGNRDTDLLTEAQVADIVAYLKSLTIQ